MKAMEIRRYASICIQFDGPLPNAATADRLRFRGLQENAIRPAIPMNACGLDPGLVFAFNARRRPGAMMPRLSTAIQELGAGGSETHTKSGEIDFGRRRT
jgi:hypothetical protein